MTSENEPVFLPRVGDSPNGAEPQGPVPVLTRLADVEPKPVDWLWDDRLPGGKLVLLDGDPALGKSTITIDWAARISTGTAWPDGKPCRRGDVIIMSAEDGLADTIRPRLDVAGGDPARVHALQAARTPDGKEHPLTLADVAVIEAAVRQTTALLVVVDVLMAYMPSGANAHRDQDVRSVLAELAAMAERTGATVLSLRHLNKSGGGNAMYRGGGSIGIIGAARAGYVVGTDPEDETRNLLACVKANLAKEPPTLAYRLVNTETRIADTDTRIARVEWLGATEHKAADLVTVRENDEERSERDEAAEWLGDYIADRDGEASAVDVYRAGQREGYSKDTLKRAKRRANVVSVKGGMNTGWVWRLASDERREHEEREERTSQDPAPFAPFVRPSGPGDPDQTEPLDPPPNPGDPEDDDTGIGQSDTSDTPTDGEPDDDLPPEDPGDEDPPDPFAEYGGWPE